MLVATWNVLHRIHAENWGEHPARTFADERARIAAVTERVVGLGCAAVGLQEVSGDQLASLRAALPAGGQLFSMRYPRVPAPRAGTRHTATLADPTEHLVTLVAPGRAAREAAAEAFPDDGGKGFLAVELGGAFLINTHVTYGARHAGQLARLAAVASPWSGLVVVVGDFNADAATVSAALGPSYTVAAPAPTARPTRPREAGGKATTIDHVVVRGGRAREVVVHDVAGVSDHNLVTAIVTIPET